MGCNRSIYCAGNYYWVGCGCGGRKRGDQGCSTHDDLRRKSRSSAEASSLRRSAYRVNHLEKSSKTFSCPASPSAKRTASWKSLTEYRTLAGGVRAPFDNMERRSLVAAHTSASGWEGTQRGSHQPRTVAVE